MLLTWKVKQAFNQDGFYLHPLSQWHALAWSWTPNSRREMHVSRAGDTSQCILLSSEDSKKYIVHKHFVILIFISAIDPIVKESNLQVVIGISFALHNGSYTFVVADTIVMQKFLDVNSATWFGLEAWLQIDDRLINRICSAMPILFSSWSVTEDIQRSSS